MANNLFVTYSLQADATTHEAMEVAIARLGHAVRLLRGVWYLRTGWGAGETAEELRRDMDPRDLLLVVDATNNELARFGMACEACEAVETLWNQ